MLKVNNLFHSSIHYALIVEATLRSDMAKRIMHSVLPAVADKPTMALSKGVIDYKALEAAIEGRKDIIKYGVKACVDELKHAWRGTSGYFGDFFLKVKDLIEEKRMGKPLDAEEAIDICIKTFRDEFAWEPGYGGFAWEKIAKQLKTIIILDKKLDIIKKEKVNPDDKIRHTAMDEEINVMKQILMELNVFDGMAHNTASIMRNLIEEEYDDLRKSKDPDYDPGYKDLQADKDIKKETYNIFHLMDTKELDSPLHVYKEIEETLKGSGDIHRYKDWNWKLKKHPDYLGSDADKRQNELLKIRIKKIAQTKIGLINDFFKKLQDGSYFRYAMLDNIAGELINIEHLIQEVIDENNIIVSPELNAMINQIGRFRPQLKYISHNLANLGSKNIPKSEKEQESIPLRERAVQLVKDIINYLSAI